MAKPLKVWSGSEWVEVAAQLVNTDDFLSNDAASANYLNIFDAASTYATLISASLTGVPTAPTAASGNNTNQLATTSFVRTEITNLIASAPSTLDTLNELAEALGDDPNFATTVTNSLSNKLDASTASATYLPISASSNYLFTGTASATYLRQDSASVTYTSLSLLSDTIDNEQLLIIAGAL